MSSRLRHWVALLVIAGAVLAVDQLTKQWVVDNLLVGESFQPVPALSSFFGITRSQNTGASFGLLPNMGDLFFIIAVIVVIAMLYYYPRVRAWLMRVAAGLIVGGAAGNAIDRIHYGHVVDFIHYQIPGLISNVSNLADHAIVLGVILIFIESWRTERAKPSEAAPAPPAQPEEREEG